MPTVRKYQELKDIKWVFEKLQTMSMQELAKEVGTTNSCVRYVVSRYFSQEMKDVIKYQRKPHKNNKKSV